MLDKYAKANIVNNISWLFFDRVARAIGGFIAISMLAKYLGASEFGKYNFVLSIVSIVGVFSSLGLKDSLIRRFVKSENEILLLVFSSFFIRLISACFGIFVCVIAVIFLRPQEADILLLCIGMSFSLLFQSSEVFKFWFESQLKSKFIVIAESVVIYIFLVVKLLLIYYKSPLINFAVALSIETFIQFIVMLFIFSRFHSFRITFYFNFSVIRSIVCESFPLLLSGIIIITTIHIDKIIIGLVLGDKMVGIFSIASQLFLFLMSFIVIFEISLYPKFVHESNDARLTLYNIGSLYRRINQLQFILIVLSFLFSGFVINYLFGSDFEGASKLFNYLMITSVIVTFARAFDQYHKTIRQFKYLVYRQFSILIINIFLTLMLIPYLGLISVVIATGISYFVVVVGTVYWGVRKYDIRYLYSRILGF
jgi:O-antigen/teichoic acid export membrane protein